MTAEDVAAAWTELQSLMGRSTRREPAVIVPCVRDARAVALLNDRLEFVDVRTSDPALLDGPRERHIGRSAYAVLPESIAERIHAAMFTVRRTGQPASFDYRTHTRAGRATVNLLSAGLWLVYEQPLEQP